MDVRQLGEVPLIGEVRTSPADPKFATPDEVCFYGVAASLFLELRQITRRSQSTVVKFFCVVLDFLQGIAYNKDDKCGSRYVIGTPKRKRPPPGAAISERGSFLVLTALQPSVKPLTNVVRSYICSEDRIKCGNICHWTTPPFP